jgi:hypothetical protein
MLYLQAKFLEARDLPSDGDFPASTLVSVLDGTEALHLVGRQDVLAAQLSDVEPFSDVTLELRPRKVDLASFGGGGKGKAYRLRVMGIVSEAKEGGR